MADVHVGPFRDIDNHMLFVDSSKRDLSKHPNSADISLEFADPFSMVVGFEILDASIPNVMFSTDATCNAFSLLIAEERRFLVDSEHAHRVSMACSRNMAPLRPQTNFAHSTLVSFVFSAGPHLHDSAHVPTGPLSATDRVIVHERLVHGATVSTRDGDDQGFVSLDGHYFVRFDDWDSPDAVEFLSSTSRENAFAVRVANGGAMQLLRVSDGSMCTDCASRVQEETSYHRVDVHAEPGNYSTQTMCCHLRDLLEPFGVDVGPAATCGSFDKCSKLMLRSERPFLVNMLGTTMARQTGFANVALGAKPQIAVGGTAMPLADLMPNNDWCVRSPGVCDNTGERYLVLRCPELENNGSAFKTKTYDGVAIFKMAAGPNCISDLRFDYKNVQPALLHPIGRVSRLSFRFERSDGRTCDFQGVDFQFLACVRTVATPRIESFGMRSSLNPNYEPGAPAATAGHVVGGGWGAESDRVGEERDEEEEGSGGEGSSAQWEYDSSNSLASDEEAERLHDNDLDSDY